MRVPPRARVTFVSAKVTKTIFPHRRTQSQALLGTGCPALLGRRGGFSTAYPYAAKYARLPGAPRRVNPCGPCPRRPPVLGATQGAGTPTPGKSIETQTSKPLRTLTLGCFLPPFRRAEHRRPRRNRPDRGAYGMRALAAGQESCRPTPVSAEKRKGLSRRRGVFSFG